MRWSRRRPDGPSGARPPTAAGGSTRCGDLLGRGARGPTSWPAPERSLDLVEPVLGPGAFAVRGLLFDKTTGANWRRPLAPGPDHRGPAACRVAGLRALDRQGGDARTSGPRSGSSERMLTVRVHLDDCGPGRARSASCPARTATAGSMSSRPPEAGSSRASAVDLPGPVGEGRGADAARSCSTRPRRPPSPEGARVIHLEFAAEPPARGRRVGSNVGRRQSPSA